MQRESSTSDWDVVGDAEIASMPQRDNTGSDDFFSSGQFHRVELSDFSPPSVEDGTGAMIHTNPAAPMRHRLPGVLSNHITAGSDADIESPIGVRRHQSNNPNPPTDSCTPTTPSTAGSALVPPSGSNSASRPHHLQLDEGRDMSSEMHQGFPSTASVDSVFQGGCFTHFSPQKLLVTTGSHGNMHPSYSSSSVATPTSPPPPRSTFPRGAASPPQVRIAASSPFLASPGGDGTGVKPPMASHQGASVARGAPNSFRPPLVPKLNFAATNGAESPSASQAPRPSAFLLACLTPRIPILLKSGISPSNGGEGILTDAQHATLRWENPTQSLVRWTMALLTLDVLHTFTTFDAGYTWTTLFGRTMVLLMVCGRLFRATQDSQNDALVSGATFAERLKQVVAERADDWANNAAVAVHGCVNTVVLDGQEAQASQPSQQTAPWMNGFHSVCRVGLACCGLEIVLGHSPVNAARVLDVAIFWCSFAALRVPLRILLSDALAQRNGVAALQRSFLGPVGAAFIVKQAPMQNSSGMRTLPVLRKGPSDMLCWGALQLLFAVCRDCATM